MKRTADRDRAHPSSAQPERDVACSIDRFVITRDDQVFRCVVICDPDIALGPQAGYLDRLVVESEHDPHRAVPFVGGGLHGLASLRDYRHTLVEGEGAGRHEGGVLAEAVAGACRRLDAHPLHRVEDDQAQGEGGQLSVAGLPQLLPTGSKEEMSQVSAGQVGCVCDELPGWVVGPGLTHPRSLRALARKHEYGHAPVTSISRL